MRTAHVINYADPACKDGANGCQREILSFIRGIRRPRTSPVTARQICNWLKVTPNDFVMEQIDALCMTDKIRIYQKSLSSGRRFNGSYVYETIK